MPCAKGSYRKYARIGPGGMKCNCCAPAPGKVRKYFMRLWKQRELHQARKEANQEAQGDINGLS